MTTVAYPHIHMDGDIPRVGAIGFKVIHLASEHYCYGWSAEELMRQHPELSPEEVYSALGYFHDHYEEMVNQIKDSADASNRLRATSPQPSRSDLIRRRHAL